MNNRIITSGFIILPGGKGKETPAPVEVQTKIDGALEAVEKPDATVVQKFAALVADRIRKAGVPNGDVLLEPLLSLVMRSSQRVRPGINLKKIHEQGQDPSHLIELSDTLAYMREAGVNPIERGDIAVHYGAGVGARNLNRVMHADARLDYCRGMAWDGYGQAVDRLPRQNPVKRELMTLLNRFPDVTRIVSSLFEAA